MYKLGANASGHFFKLNLCKGLRNKHNSYRMLSQWTSSSLGNLSIERSRHFLSHYFEPSLGVHHGQGGRRPLSQGG